MASVLESPLTTSAAVEPLRNGDVLDQPTFHERYEAMPSSFRAELIEGVVYVPSPVSNWHLVFQGDISTWLGVYRVNTPGVDHGATGTVILNDRNEPQPDALLRILETAGGKSRVNEKAFLAGTPELHVEISYSSQSIDLHQKRRAYERAGVQEYIVILLREPAVRFFRLQNQVYQEVNADADGVWRSSVFPGLWLNVRALLDRDGKALLETLQQGIDSADHKAFVGRLQHSAP
jgi:Uma2 family endonuclease